MAADSNTLTLEGERDAIRALVSQGEDFHWQMGVHYNNIVDNKLAQKHGYRDAHAFIAKELKDLKSQISQSQLSLYGAVARAFTQEAARRFGTTKLGRLQSYAVLTRIDPLPPDPGDIIVYVPRRGGAPEEKPFSACSVADINAAIDGLKPDVPEMPPSDVEYVKKLQAAVIEVLGPQSGAVVRVRAESGSLLSLENIPLPLFRALVDAFAVL